MAKERLQFPVLVEKSEDGFFVAECPAIRGCFTQGKTLDEALKNIKEAIKLCIDVQRKEKVPLMKKSGSFGFYTVDVRV